MNYHKQNKIFQTHFVSETGRCKFTHHSFLQDMQRNNFSQVQEQNLSVLPEWNEHQHAHKALACLTVKNK